MSKKKAPKGAFYSPAGGFFSQKKKVVFENVKHSSNKKDISLYKSKLDNNVFSDVNSVSGNEKSANMIGIDVGSLLDLTANTPKAKHINTGAIFGSSLGSPNFVMDDNEDISFSFCLSISLKKKWIDLKIIKTQVEMSAKKFFTLDINLSAVEGKSVTAKTQLIKNFFSLVNDFGGATTPSKFKGIIRFMFTFEESMIKAASLAREKRIVINSDLRRQEMRSDWAVIIKEIPMDTPKDMIITTQKAVMEFAELSQADLLVFKWSFLIGKDSVHMAKAVKNCKTWASRDWFRVLLFILLVRTTAHNLGTLLDRASEKTCIINRSLETSNRICCAVIGFEFDNDLKSAFCMEPILESVKLSWTKMDLVWYEKCGKFGHSALECDTLVVSPSKPLRTFKRVASDGYCLQLTKLYEKKGVPISWPAAFGDKSWAQVVSLAGPSGGSCFSNSSGSSLPLFGALDSINDSSLILANNSSLNNCLNILEHSLELLMDQVSSILKKLSGIELVPMVIPSSVLPPATSAPLVPHLDVDMALDDMTLASTSTPLLLAINDVIHDSSSSFSKVLTFKMGFNWFSFGKVRSSVFWCRFFSSPSVLMTSLVWKIATCNVRGINNPAKQDNIIHWHKNMNNLISIFTETKLKGRVHSWITNKFDGVCVFISGLDSGHLDSGVAIVMNNSLARHVCKVSKMPRQLLSIRLLFNNKLFIMILGLYAGAFLDVWFSQAGNINLLIVRTVNKSFFVVLSGDFNKNSSHKSASFKKYSDLSLVNSLGGNLFAKMPMWANFQGVFKTIDYIFVSYNLVSVVINHGVVDVGDHFNSDHRAVSVCIDLGGLLDMHLNFICRQANKDYWKYDIKSADNVKWCRFKVSMAANAIMFSEEFASSVVSSDLNSMWDIVRKGSSRFHRLEILVLRIVKVFRGQNFVRFISLISHWDFLDSDKALAVQILLDSGANFNCVRTALFESFASNKDYTIKSVLEYLFYKMELNHLVVGDKLILEPELVKAKSLEYVFDGAFLGVMQPIVFDELFGVISDLLDSKAAGLFGISNKFWKHCNNSVICMLLELLNTCLIIESVPSFWKEAWILMIPKPYK
ncbi:hypothetical protein G9A89_015906 [Geosiphon pyriformis]|nr:hypothetical protein G9A89_015906 [Geosiphon pyriformis]